MNPRERNHHIQALRGVAASLVVLAHALQVVVEHGILPLWFEPVGYSIGALGVTTFFVISGAGTIRYIEQSDMDVYFVGSILR
jgi:peptidoglycan/LPS O-acetylase OafA/YrhL